MRQYSEDHQNNEDSSATKISKTLVSGSYIQKHCHEKIKYLDLFYHFEQFRNKHVTIEKTNRRRGKVTTGTKAIGKGSTKTQVYTY